MYNEKLQQEATVATHGVQISKISYHFYECAQLEDVQILKKSQRSAYYM